MAQNSGLKQSYTFMRIKAPKPNEPELAAFARKVNENFEAISTKIYNGIEYKNLHSSAQTAIDNKVKHATWRVVITCSGATETVGQQTENVTLNADVFVLGKLATSAIDAAQFKWTRESGDSVADAAWNTDHTSMKSVTILAADRMKNALYTCEVTDPNSSAVASGSISLKNQTVEARFIASDTVFGLFRASDGAPIAVGGVDASGLGYFAASQLRDAAVASDFACKIITDVDGHGNQAYGLDFTTNNVSIGKVLSSITQGGSPSQMRILARNGSDLVIHGNVDVSIGAARCLSLTSTDALSIEGMGVSVDHNAGAMTITGHVLPAITNTYALGSKSRNLRWTRLYCVQSPDVSSDARLKTDIEDIDGSLIYKLRPRKFRMKDGSGKLRFGLIAQEVKTVLDELGIDGADLYGDENPDSLSLVYEELIAPLIAAVQEQKSRIDDLESRLSALENRLLNQ